MKPNTKPLPGMMELLPQEQIEFDRVLGVIKKHHANYGFSPIDTPIIERTETLLAKAGGETEKQIYRFKKGDHDLSLRFDLTVPTARFVADNFGELTFPFKRSQIGKVYRGERSQRGRFREFYQCDIDVIGRDTLSVNYDAEVIAVIYEIFRELNFGKFTLRINNRNIISGLISSLGLNNKSSDIMALIDRAEKISSDEFHSQLTAFGFSKDNNQIINQFIDISGESREVLDRLRQLSGFLPNNERFNQGIDELTQVSEILLAMGVSEDYFKLDMLIVRGLDYYTGTVFETNLNDFKEIGSVASGGRYDSLVSYYSKEKLPGVGASIGLTRLFGCLRELELIKAGKKTPAEILILPFSNNELNKSLEIATDLRTKNIKVEVLLEDMSVKKAFKLADKRGVEFVLPVGENEVSSNNFMVKNMISGATTDLGSWVKNL
ncbi:MAG: histidine--tRNA ligase [Candidatus Nanogingivalis sp.]